MSQVSETEPPLLNELAKRYGVTRQAFLDWRKIHGCPCDSIEAADAWVGANRPEKLPGNRPSRPRRSVHDREKLAKARRTEQQVRKLRIENDKAEGRTVDRDEIIQEFAEYLSQAKPLLEAFIDEAAKSAPQELRVTVHELARHHVYLVLRKLSAWRPGSVG